MAKNIPANERIWVSYIGLDGKRLYVLTSKEFREKYFLYSVSEDGGVVRLGECSSPLALEERFEVLDKIRIK